MNLTTHTSRRSFLRNGTKALTLPFLVSLLPSGSRALAEQALASGSPKRLLWLSMGHGHMEKHFYPKEGGHLSDISLPPGWEPMRKNLDHVTMVSNFSNLQNRQPHEGSEAVLTCANVVGFSGKARHNSVSCDQVAAAQLGKGTRHESLQLNCVNGDSGNGHGGVAMSYREDGSPLPGLASPLEVFFKIYGGNVSREEMLRTLKQRRSVFDILEFEGGSTQYIVNQSLARLSDPHFVVQIDEH